MDRRRVEYAAPAPAVEEVPHGLAGAEERAPEVHRKDPVVGIHIRLVGGAGGLDPGVVDQYIEPPPRAENLAEYAADIFLVRDIPLDQHLPASLPADDAAGCLCLLKRYLRLRLARVVVDGDVCAFICKPDSRRPSDAGRTAGDEDVLSLKSSHTVSPRGPGRVARTASCGPGGL